MTSDIVKACAEGLAMYIGERFKGPHDTPYDGPVAYHNHPRHQRAGEIVQAMANMTGLHPNETRELFVAIFETARLKARGEWEEATTEKHKRQVLQGLKAYAGAIDGAPKPLRPLMEVKLLLDDIASYPPWDYDAENIARAQESVMTQLCNHLAAGNYTYTRIQIGEPTQSTFLIEDAVTNGDRIADDFYFRIFCGNHGDGPWPVSAQVFNTGSGGCQADNAAVNILRALHDDLIERGVIAPQGDPVSLKLELAEPEEEDQYPEM